MGKNFWAKIILCLFIGGVVTVMLVNISTALTAKGLLVADPEPSEVAAPLMDKVILADYNLVEHLGHMVQGQFTVKNTSDREVKNINVMCEFFDAANKYLDREQWLLNGSVPAGKVMRHASVGRRFVHTGARGMKCRIVNFGVAEEPFFKLHRVEGGHGDAAEHGHH